jgi:ribosomal-protein-alanine N-acetyltransferase
LEINLNPFPELPTNHLLLRRLQLSDSRDLLALRSDERVNQYIDRPATATIAEAEAFIHKIDSYLAINQSVYWAISLQSTGALTGTICLWNFLAEKEMAEIGFELMPYYQGQGLMQEAIEKVIEYGFDKMELKIISALVHADNEKSVRLLMKTNFKKDLDYRYVGEDEADGLTVYFLTANGQ